MNRRELVQAVAAHTGLDVKLVDSVIAGTTDVITAVVSKGEPVTIQGFAKFAKVERAARMGHNPRTGEAIRIKATKRVRVSPMKAFKDAVLSPNQALRLASGVYPTSPELLARQAAGRRTAAAPAKATIATKKATTKRTAAKKAARATTPTGKRTTAKRTTAKRTTAKRTTAKRTTAKRTTAKRTARR